MSWKAPKQLTVTGVMFGSLLGCTVLFYAVLFCVVQNCFVLCFVAAGGLTCAKSPLGGQSVMTGTSVPS